MNTKSAVTAIAGSHSSRTASDERSEVARSVSRPVFTYVLSDRSGLFQIEIHHGSQDAVEHPMSGAGDDAPIRHETPGEEMNLVPSDCESCRDQQVPPPGYCVADPNGVSLAIVASDEIVYAIRGASQIGS